MDPNKPTSTKPVSRPVMDIRVQRPVLQPINRANAQVARPNPVPSQPLSTPSPSPAPQVVAQPRPVTALPEKPAVQTPFTPPARIVPQPMPPVPVVPGASTKPLVPLSKVKAPIAAIIIALLVGAALIGLTVYAYVQDERRANQNVDNSVPTQAQPEEVDESVKAIDDELNTLDDDKDFDSQDISDQSLGL